MPKKAKAPLDPSLPLEVLAAIETTWAEQRDSGLLIAGFGRLCFAGDLRAAIAAQWPDLNPAQLAAAERAIRAKASADLHAQRRSGRNWVNAWAEPNPRAWTWP